MLNSSLPFSYGDCLSGYLYSAGDYLAIQSRVGEIATSHKPQGNIF